MRIDYVELCWKVAYIDAFNRIDAALQQPADTELSFSLAAEAAAQVHRTVFNAVMEADPDKWQHSRYLLNLNYDSQGRPPYPAPCPADCPGHPGLKPRHPRSVPGEGRLRWL